MNHCERRAFDAGKEAARLGRSYIDALEELAASTKKQEEYFFLGYFENHHPNGHITESGWAFSNLQPALDEFFDCVASAPGHKEYECCATCLEKRLAECAPNAYQRFSDALFGYLEDMQRFVWLRGVSTALRRKSSCPQDARLYGLDGIRQLPHIREDEWKLNVAREAVEKEFKGGHRPNIALYEQLLTAEYFRAFPWWFNHGYLCGVELGARTIQRYRENKELTAALLQRFFP